MATKSFQLKGLNVRRLIDYLIEVFGVNTVDRAVKGMTKAMNNLDKVVDRQQAKALRMADAAARAVAASEAAAIEATKASKVKKNLTKLFD
jgi:hypothetical protein